MLNSDIFMNQSGKSQQLQNFILLYSDVGARSSFTWSKIDGFATNVRLSTGFLTKFTVGCGTNCTATEKKHVCNLVSL